jgi:hypothetical protein
MQELRNLLAATLFLPNVGLGNLTGVYGRDGGTALASRVLVGVEDDKDLLLQLGLPAPLLRLLATWRVFPSSNAMMRGRWTSST